MKTIWIVLKGKLKYILIKSHLQKVGVFIWRPQGGSNPRYRRERAVS